MEEVKVRHFAEADQPDMPMHLRNMIILGVANSQIWYLVIYILVCDTKNLKNVPYNFLFHKGVWIRLKSLTIAPYCKSSFVYQKKEGMLSSNG